MTIKCDECKTTFNPKKATARFCSTPCRKLFNNRRAQRGALLYDAFMAMRYDRKAAKELQLDYKLVCRIGEMFHDQDVRDDVQSWRDPADMLIENKAKINARRKRV